MTRAAVKGRDTITGDYVFQMAERIEKNGMDFYLLAAERAPALAQPALRALAEQEAGHQQQFAEMRHRLALPAGQEIDPDGPAARTVRRLLAGKLFDPQADPADFFTGRETFRDILLAAIRAERDSIAFYEGVKTLVAGPTDRQAVDLIIEAERGHIAQLTHYLDMLEHEHVT